MSCSAASEPYPMARMKLKLIANTDLQLVNKKRSKSLLRENHMENYMENTYVNGQQQC